MALHCNFCGLVLPTRPNGGASTRKSEFVSPFRSQLTDQSAAPALFSFRSSSVHLRVSAKRHISAGRQYTSQWRKLFVARTDEPLFHPSKEDHVRPLACASITSEQGNPVDGFYSYRSEDNRTLRHRRRGGFKNRFLNFTRLGAVLNHTAESFFKSEIRRRIFITAILLIISRIGHFIPLPGFNRSEIPQDYLSFTRRSADGVANVAPQLKLSLFQLGLSPQIMASIVMQVLCYTVPSLVKLRKESLDWHEKIKTYIWWMSLAFALLEALVLSCCSLPYSTLYAATHLIKHVIISSILMTSGAMCTIYICDKISQSGLGQGSSLVICMGITAGYGDTLYRMMCQLSASTGNWWAYVLVLLVIFTVVTMWAVLVTEGCRKVKLKYYGFKLAPSSAAASHLTDPYIPFNINPSGMQPVLTTTYLLSFPAVLASILKSPFWTRLKRALDPELGRTNMWVYYSAYALLVFAFNIYDIANMPMEMSIYLNKMDARVPMIKPGKQTINHLSKVQASTRFWGGLLLSMLATSSSMLDHYLRRIDEGYAIGFTSVLILVGSIIELRRSYHAYNVMPSLTKALSRYKV